MVLQNKFKARASRSYNKTHGDGNSAAKQPVRRHRQVEHANFNDAESGSDSDATSDEDEDPNFPSLSKAATATGSASVREEEKEEDPANPSTGKYARRRVGESRLAMMERLEAEKDPRLAQEEESEAEVDLSGLMAKVVALGDTAPSQAGLSHEIARQRAAHETASDVEQDIDHSLAYLHEKERLRQKAKGRGAEESTSRPVTIDTVSSTSEELEEMRKAKEHAEAVRALKARFQGRDIGEREDRNAKSRNAPSLDIGPKSSASSIASESTVTPARDAAFAAEIDRSLAKARRNGDGGSISSERSSFTTSFGRSRGNSVNPKTSPPVAGSSSIPLRTSPLLYASAQARTPSPPSQSEGIDGFLHSLNDRSVFGAPDQSVFTLSGGNSSNKTSNRFPTSAHACYHHHQQQRWQPQIQHQPGELGRMENFLDSMLR